MYIKQSDEQYAPGADGQTFTEPNLKSYRKFHSINDQLPAASVNIPTVLISLLIPPSMASYF